MVAFRKKGAFASIGKVTFADAPSVVYKVCRLRR